MSWDRTSLREFHNNVVLPTTLEGDWSLPVEIISPGGIKQKNLTGQVLFNRVEVEMETSNLEQPQIVSKPVVTLRISSLNRVPQPKERWIVRCPREPRRDAPLQSYLAHRAPTGGDSIGFITLHCDRIVQE